MASEIFLLNMNLLLSNQATPEKQPVALKKKSANITEFLGAQCWKTCTTKKWFFSWYDQNCCDNLFISSDFISIWAV